MEWDEAQKDIKMELIEHYKKLLEIYNMDHQLATADFKTASEMVRTAKSRMRMGEAALAIIKHRLGALGVRIIDEDEGIPNCDDGPK